MRGLKIAAIASVSLVLVLVLLVGYLFLTAEVQVVKVSAQGVPAANDSEGFERLRASVEEETFQGTLFQKPLEWKDAGEYVYLDYTLHIRNSCLVPIDMVEIQVTPQSGDILQIGGKGARALSAKSEGDVSARILAPKDSHPVREILVTYYVWGVSFSMKTTYGE